MRPRVLDLFCGGGGASMGYYHAGFEPVGVDIARQPLYPFAFEHEDAIEVAIDRDYLRNFDLIHASPPCQGFTRAKHLRDAQGGACSTPSLIEDVRQALRNSGVPYIIENVPGAPLIPQVTLCGSMFGLKVRRHRVFESSLALMAPGPCRHHEQGRPVGVYHVLNDDIPKGGRTARTLQEAQDAMGIHWLPWGSLKEAIPPDYTLSLGRQVLARG